IAEETIISLADRGLDLKMLNLTAKEKICFLEESNCDPDYFIYAKGHYDRINEALLEILEKENIIRRAIVEKYAEKYKVCPFEFSLDIANWVDIVICDYNYLFDPRVALKRFFEEEERDYLFLVDEAHNLVDRARDMYSSELFLGQFFQLKDSLQQPKIKGSTKKLISYLDRIISIFMDYQEQILEGNIKQPNLINYKNQEKYFLQKELALDLYPIFNGFINRAEEWLIKNKEIKNEIKGSKENNVKSERNEVRGKDERAIVYQLVLEGYFRILSFLRIMDLYSDNYITYFQETENDLEYDNIDSKENLFNYQLADQKPKIEKDLRLKLFCLDPAPNLKEVLKNCRSAVFFSATLSPLDYYQELLAGEDDYYLQLSSPFDSSNLCLLTTDSISTKYRDRKAGYSLLVDFIYRTVKSKKGNYLIFFPSYTYMEAVYQEFIKKYPDIKTLIQSRKMSEKNRLAFLEEFQENSDQLLAFAILGGIFSEGIDLKGERLIGSLVVGVAHPQLSLENELIRDYFQKKSKMGYEFAYLYPGINKVLQAAGRTIRTESDRGLVFLIGERFENYRYSSLLPVYWQQNKRRIITIEELDKSLMEFWE
ncbi:MAG: ATP-dependent DNA helicase, partial [bacterium]